MREYLVFISFCLLLITFPGHKVIDIYYQDCGPYCCDEDITIPISCSDNLGGAPNEYEYVTDVGLIQINGVTGLPEIFIEGGAPCGQITVITWSCRCLDTDCSKEGIINVEVCDKPTVTGLCRDFFVIQG